MCLSHRASQVWSLDDVVLSCFIRPTIIRCWCPVCLASVSLRTFEACKGIIIASRSTDAERKTEPLLKIPHPATLLDELPHVTIFYLSIYQTPLVQTILSAQPNNFNHASLELNRHFSNLQQHVYCDTVNVCHKWLLRTNGGPRPFRTAIRPGRPRGRKRFLSEVCLYLPFAAVP